MGRMFPTTTKIENEIDADVGKLEVLARRVEKM
jgi:hypothetical protein